MASAARVYCVLLLGVCTLAAQDAAPTPFEWKSRWDNYLDRTYGWRTIGAVAAEDAIEQTFQLSKCGRPPYCLPHHVGGALVRRTARTTIELGAGALFKEDLQRRPSGLPRLKDRIAYALIHAPLAKAPDGSWGPAYSRYLGTFGAIAVTSAYQGRPMTTGHLATCFAWSASSYFQDALFSEFEPDMRRVGRRLWRETIARFHRDGRTLIPTALR